MSLRQLAAGVKTSTMAVSLFGGKAGLLGSLHQEAVCLFAWCPAAVCPRGDPADDVIRTGQACCEAPWPTRLGLACENRSVYGVETDRFLVADGRVPNPSH
ncbi:hypothetical protein [Streptomyces sp. NPDC006335]|uniref:hypothetical protein n=1 Tax=Streptomyces sp. NPDC006335 TaxID=3156895 RepID=UPI0033ACBCEB